MERKVEIALEKIKMLEVVVFNSEKEREKMEVRRKKELDITWAAMASLSEEARGYREKIVELEEKIYSLEAKDKEEKEEIWQELESWNREWERKKKEEEERGEAGKIERFNDRRDEEARKAKIDSIEKCVKAVWAALRDQEREVDVILVEARRAMLEMRKEMEKIRRECEKEDGNGSGEVKVEEAIRVGKGLIDLLREKLILGEKSKEKVVEGKVKNRLAIGWQTEEEEQ